MNSILIIGYGNPGRLDDGLGPALAEKIALDKLPDVTVDQDYQLNIEYAHDVAQADITIFLDASVSGEEAYDFYELQPEAPLSFSSHSVSPQAILFLAHSLFDSQAKAYMLSIRGYAFNEFGEMLSDRAKDNLNEAYEFLIAYVKKRTTVDTPSPQLEGCAL